jgi:hypothetical protein
MMKKRFALTHILPQISAVVQYHDIVARLTFECAAVEWESDERGQVGVKASVLRTATMALDRSA